LKKLNFGCGKKILKGWVNADIQKAQGIVSFDFEKYPYPFENDTFEYVLSNNVFEHLEDPERVLLELHRIAKPNAIIRIIVPHHKCEGAYNDITHKKYFNEVALKQIIKGSSYSCNEKCLFEIVKIKSIPTVFGKLFVFEKLRYFANLIFSGVYRTIDVEARVVK
jgi:ubiquinone/menaquinone biosynthesis C-methylase UbiE